MQASLSTSVQTAPYNLVPAEREMHSADGWLTAPLSGHGTWKVSGREALTTQPSTQGTALLVSDSPEASVPDQRPLRLSVAG